MFVIDKKTIRIQDVVNIARNKEHICLSEEVKTIIDNGRIKFNESHRLKEPIYGITTGFGSLMNKVISIKDQEQLQYNLVRSHATGVGNVFPVDIVRATIFLKIIALSRGNSGVRLEVVEKLIELLNKNICPVVPCQGSVGASGDLVPLAHIALVLLGEGKVLKNEEAVDSKIYLEEMGFSPVKLLAKEGLALINGTQVMTALAALICYDAKILFKSADLAGALSFEALRGNIDAFDLQAMEMRPHKGQIAVAKNMLLLTQNSDLYNADRKNIQDAYSIRCIPQVHGASRDALARTEETVLIEINSVTDNPIIIPNTGEIICEGNFHGQPIALVMDYMKLAICEIGDISERRLSRLLDGHLSGLPEYLIDSAGLNSGLMIAQYTSAALVSENKVLSHPASVDSIPTSANQEDHVSMGTIAARQAKEILDNVNSIVAIEILAAAQGIDCLKYYALGRGTETAYRYIRNCIACLKEDKALYDDINKIKQMITTGTLINAVESVIGSLE